MNNQQNIRFSNIAELGIHRIPQTALKQLCDKFKNEHFNIVYDEYGWSLEERKVIDGEGGGGGGSAGKEATFNASDVSVDRLEGFCVDIFKEFVRLCPIQYRLYKNKDGKWGNFDEEKNEWDGMIGELVEAKADMGRCLLGGGREGQRDTGRQRQTGRGRQGRRDGGRESQADRGRLKDRKTEKDRETVRKDRQRGGSETDK